MPIDHRAYENLIEETKRSNALLVAVSKTRPPAEIEELYHMGQRDFGENRVQELLEKVPQLPSDIRWHAIGHLQRNKVKQIVPFVHLIHGVDSLRLAQEIDKQALNVSRTVDVLIQFHIAQEEAKHGFALEEAAEVLPQLHQFNGIRIRGLMGMATFTTNMQEVQVEFQSLQQLYEAYRNDYGWDTLSMGMSGDYQQALAEGSTMIRVGSHIFGPRLSRLY